MTEELVKLALSGGGGVALAVLVHWHLTQLRADLASVSKGVAVLLDRVGHDGAPA